MSIQFVAMMTWTRALSLRLLLWRTVGGGIENSALKLQVSQLLCHRQDWRRSLDVQLCRKSYSRALSARGAAYVVTGTGAALMRLARIQVLTEAVIGFRVIRCA
jgi:hypothetical protein